MKYPALFSGLILPGDLALKNRLVMAPMTRCFADSELAVTRATADYYAARAEAGLIVTEATMIDQQAQGYPRTPGIYTDVQIKAWQQVTEAVHAQNGRIFCQLWHTGRMAHSHYTGAQPVAPSAVALEASVPRAAELTYEIPRPLQVEEIKDLVNAYAQAAQNARQAGFDGVELHGANGYLIDQFLHQQTNRRTDDYGGSPENRTRFALEVIDAIITAVDSFPVAVRLSPQAYINLDYTEGDEKTFDILLDALNQRSLAYVHVAAFDANQHYDYLDGRPLDYIRRHYNGVVIGCGGFTAEVAEDSLIEKQLDLVAFGRSFIANPDLISLIRLGHDLNPYDESLLGSLA